jgi:hypothetical protein
VRRQHPVELGQGGQRRLLDAGHRSPGRGTEGDGDGRGLVVVEQQRRQRRPGAQPVATPGRTGTGIEPVAERPQPIDVAADGAGRHLQPLGQLGARPVGPLLQQRQQPEQPVGRGHRGGLSQP